MKLVDSLPDIQACEPDYPFNLTRVGVTGVKKLVKVERGNDERPVVLISNFEVFVDLPSDRKGANLSRNFEVIDEVLEEAINCPVYEIEELCGEIAKRLLSRHEYASRAEVKMKSEYIVHRQTPVTKVNCQEVVDIFAEAVARAGPAGYVRKTVGAEVLGMTACPCAQEIMKEEVRQELAKAGLSLEEAAKLAERLPVATHNQRGRGSISVEVRDRRCVSIDRIIKIIEESMSSKVYGLLKRPDEAVVVKRAHSNPKFVEDVVRDSVLALRADDRIRWFEVECEAEESIHQHSAFAYASEG